MRYAYRTTYVRPRPRRFVPSKSAVSVADLGTWLSNGAGTASVSALLTAANLLPTSNGASTASASLLTAANLVPTSNGASTMTAQTEVPAPLGTVAADGASSATISLLTAANLVPTANGAGTATVSLLTTTAQFVAVANGSGDMSANLQAGDPAPAPAGNSRHIFRRKRLWNWT